MTFDNTTPSKMEGNISSPLHPARLFRVSSPKATQSMPRYSLEEEESAMFVYELFRVLLFGAMHAVLFQIKVSPENERLMFWSTRMFEILKRVEP
ncbi:MAG: hypothetical protein SGARI_007342 [Bacillariaceae sp.]